MAESGEEKKGINPVVVAIVVVAVVVVAIAVLGQKQKFTPVVAGTEAPGFTLPGLEGGEVSLEGFRGKVVFLNFWATWCDTCVEEIPSMERLYRALGRQPFEIIAVSVDSEGPEVVEKFLEPFGVTFTVLHDRGGRVKELYKTTGVPETFIIGPDGVVAEKVIGPRDWTNPRNITTILDLLQKGAQKAGKQG